MGSWQVNLKSIDALVPASGIYKNSLFSVFNLYSKVFIKLYRYQLLTVCSYFESLTVFKLKFFIPDFKKAIVEFIFSTTSTNNKCRIVRTMLQYYSILIKNGKSIIFFYYS